MEIDEWTNIVGVSAEIVTGAAAVVVAIVAHRFSVRSAAESQRRQENELRLKESEKKRQVKREAQESMNTFVAAYEAWFKNAREERAAASLTLNQGRSLIVMLQMAGRKTKRLSTALDVLEGQQFFVLDSERSIRWAIQGADQKTDREWVEGIANGLLDVIKDYVLDSDQSPDELSYIDDSFWTELATPYFDDDKTDVLSLKIPKKLFRSAYDRWLPKGAPEPATRRIRQLIGYKLMAEHSLAVFLYLDFNLNSADGFGKDEIFKLSSLDVTSKILNEILGQAQGEIDLIAR